MQAWTRRRLLLGAVALAALVGSWTAGATAEELQRYIDAGLAVPHDLAQLPNQQQTLPQFRDLAQVRGVARDGKVYGMPFAFDSIGLLYDTTKVSIPSYSMNVLWDPAYNGKILLYRDGGPDLRHGPWQAGPGRHAQG
ncbi:MAG: extracellular solute-binding protein [Geminicoccaceae bacterium]